MVPKKGCQFHMFLGVDFVQPLEGAGIYIYIFLVGPFLAKLWGEYNFNITPNWIYDKKIRCRFCVCFFYINHFGGMALPPYAILFRWSLLRQIRSFRGSVSRDVKEFRKLIDIFGTKTP